MLCMFKPRRVEESKSRDHDNDFSTSIPSLTSRFHQRQCFEITGHQHLLQLPVGRMKGDKAHVPDHDVLDADVVPPEMWCCGRQRARWREQRLQRRKFK